MPARTSTRFMSSSMCISDELTRKCHRRHIHQPLEGGRGGPAAVYPAGICKAILQVTAKQRIREGRPLPESMKEDLDKGIRLYTLEKCELLSELVELDEAVPIPVLGSHSHGHGHNSSYAILP